MEKLKVSMVANVFVKSNIIPNGMRLGTLYLTPTHIIFTEKRGSKEKWIPMVHVSCISCSPGTHYHYPMDLESKTFLFLTFIFEKSRDRQRVYVSLQEILENAGNEELFCLRYKTLDPFPQVSGWDQFDEISEFSMMGINKPNRQWIVSPINNEHQICDSYPEFLCIPTSAKMHIIQASANFRYRRRFPVVTYYHAASDTALSRSAHPDNEFSARCIEDEKLLVNLALANPSKRLHVLDIYDSNEMSTSSKSRDDIKGQDVVFEKSVMMSLQELKFSLQNLTRALVRADISSPEYFNGISESRWLLNVHLLLSLANKIAIRMTSGENVLVQCPTGVDYASQVCSLVQLLMEPRYRTLEGFQKLIEKDWISFSHPFPWRCRYMLGYAEEHAGPIFTQFLDAVWQIWRQLPTAFEFNENLLIALHDHSQGSQFGTFTCNSSIQRKKLRLSSRSFSLWGYIKYHRNFYINSLFRPLDHKACIWPILSPKQMQVWHGLYNRWESSLHSRNAICDALTAMVDQTCIWTHQSHVLEYYIQQLNCRMKNQNSKRSRRSILSTMSISNRGVNGTSSPSPDSLAGYASTMTNGTSCDFNESSFDSRPSASSLESGLGLSMDSPTSEISCTAVPRTCNGEHSTPTNTTAISHTPKHCPSPECEQSNTQSLASNIENLLDDVAASTLPWVSLRSAKNCPGCLQELNNSLPKRHCWECGRIQCQRCLRSHFHPPQSLKFTTDPEEMAGRLKICLACERRCIDKYLDK